MPANMLLLPRENSLQAKMLALYSPKPGNAIRALFRPGSPFPGRKILCAPYKFLLQNLSPNSLPDYQHWTERSFGVDSG
jgi:hypothetical protein